MKKFTSIILILVFANRLQAAPAAPEPVTFTQPGGQNITVLLRGDEKSKRMETPDGYTLMYNQQGFIVYATLDKEGNLVPSDMVATDTSKLRSADMSGFLQQTPKHLSFSPQQREKQRQDWVEDTTSQPPILHQFKAGAISQKNILVVLVNFKDKKFTKTKEEFENLINQNGYNVDSSQGSVKDFFIENSYGKLDILFTVAGMVTLSQNAAYYGANDNNGRDIRRREFATEVANEIAKTFDFSLFDADNNKYIDGFHIIFAGRGEEAGGGADCIWSHKWTFAQTLIFNGKWLQVYSCSPELYKTKITTIGVICHEMTHSLFNSPDYYDTNEEIDGNFLGTGKWDLMGDGSWNGFGSGQNGNCPAHINMYEKIRLGWTSATELSGNQAVTDMPNSADNPLSYQVYTPADGGYFLLENKQKKGFDSALPGSGLVIWRIHADLPNYLSDLNETYPQMLYPVCASSSYAISGNTPESYGEINKAGCPFPGSSGNTSFGDNTIPSMRATPDSENKTRISGITDISGLVSFNFEDNRVNFQPTQYNNDDKEGLRIFLRQISSNTSKRNFEQLNLTPEDTLSWYDSEAWINKISTTKGMGSYETNSGILWNNSIPNRIVAIYWRARGLGGNMDANSWKSLRTLYCNDNSLYSIRAIANSNLSKVYCENNYLLFSGMPVQTSILTTYNYNPQKRRARNTIHFYDPIDLSREYTIDGKNTIYTWYDITDGNENQIQLTGNSGNFTLTPDFCGKKLRCKMQNQLFPNLISTQALIYEAEVMQPTLKIYPIPTSGQLTIDNDHVPVGKIQIYDVTRRLVLETDRTNFDISRLLQGVYYLKVEGKIIPILKAP